MSNLGATLLPIVILRASNERERERERESHTAREVNVSTVGFKQEGGCPVA
jgi:hypothetical protein